MSTVNCLKSYSPCLFIIKLPFIVYCVCVIMNWHKENTLFFINLIRKRPVIWDASLSDHEDKIKKYEAFKEVSKLMGISIKEAKTKWISLRGQYNREKKRSEIRTGSGADALQTSKWFAYNVMESLMGCNIPQESFCNIVNNKTEDSSCSPPPAPSPRLSRSANQHSHPKDCVAQTTSIYNQAIKTFKAIREANNDRTSDDLTNYGLYITAHLRKFSPPLQSRAKYEINKILYALDLESLGEYSATTSNVDSDDIFITKESKFDPLQKD